MLADCTRFVGALCRHPFMDFPTLQPLLHATTRVVHMAARVLHPMLPWHATPPDSTAECASGLILLQLSAFGLAAIFKARQEHRLFAQHQWQRLRAGLEPERGFHARVYSAAAALLEPGRGELLWAGALLVIFHHAVITVMLHAHLL